MNYISKIRINNFIVKFLHEILSRVVGLRFEVNGRSGEWLAWSQGAIATKFREAEGERRAFSQDKRQPACRQAGSKKQKLRVKSQ